MLHFSLINHLYSKEKQLVAIKTDDNALEKESRYKYPKRIALLLTIELYCAIIQRLLRVQQLCKEITLDTPFSWKRLHLSQTLDT